MEKKMIKMMAVLAVLLLNFSVLACSESAAKSSGYVWNEVTRAAQFPTGYNYPVFVLNGEMLALNNGGWTSKDGANWTKTDLPESGLNSAYQKFVQFGGAVYALGAMQGNYLDFKLSTKISRTRDGKTWEVLSEKSNLPARVFYGAAVFKDKIWLVGGWDGKKYYNDVWNSADGVNWTRVTEKAAWSERTASIIVFKNKLLLIGGGVIDGDKNVNPDSGNEFWTSEDGVNWTQIKTNREKNRGGTPIVFDDKLWLVGANRGNEFQSGVLFSEDIKNWQEMKAPWSPRGAVAVWIFGDKLFMTGGKSSYVKNGETKFVYSNDVWAMNRRAAN
jgi:hypothetical protein